MAASLSPRARAELLELERSLNRPSFQPPSAPPPAPRPGDAAPFAPPPGRRQVAATPPQAGQRQEAGGAEGIRVDAFGASLSPRAREELKALAIAMGDVEGGGSGGR